MPSPTAVPFVLTECQRKQLESFAASRSLPHSLVVRARSVLQAADGATNGAIAKRLQLTRVTVGKWRKRFVDRGIEGLYDELRCGRPRTVEAERIASLISETLAKRPEGSTHWSCRTMAKDSGLSKSTVQRVWNTFGLKPHRHQHFKLSTDPFFVDKVIDIIGLYLNPPENAVVYCVDEKSRCQALERSQPILPMDLGYVEGITHDYVRHGTASLFAGLDIANGTVLHNCNPRHRHQEFLSFLHTIDKNGPEELDVHIVLDNYSTHKHSKVKAWLARHRRFHFHFTPIYSWWLNQVEPWSGINTERAIRCGSFSRVRGLTEKIDTFVAAFNRDAVPFRWTATAESIFEKLERLCIRISETGH